MTAGLGCAVIHICHHLSTQDQAVSKATRALEAAEERRDEVQEQLERSKRMHRVVCREACALLDPPLVGPGGAAQGPCTRPLSHHSPQAGQLHEGAGHGAHVTARRGPGVASTGHYH